MEKKEENETILTAGQKSLFGGKEPRGDVRQKKKSLMWGGYQAPCKKKTQLDAEKGGTSGGGGGGGGCMVLETGERVKPGGGKKKKIS